jgi:hypothetical protein
LFLFFGFWISLIYRFFTESGKNYKYILAVAIAATQSYARKTKAILLAPDTAFNLAATLLKLLATLSNWRKYCPKHLPHVILLLPTQYARLLVSI